MVIIYSDKGAGWSPISHMVKLAARLLEAELIILDHKSSSIRDKLGALILKRQRNLEGEKLLLICSSPSDLELLFQVKNFRYRFEYIVAWVIDSFWVEHIPKAVRFSGYFDHIFITSREDIDKWRKITCTPISWLPWASDVLGLGGVKQSRKWDLVRVGRQPSEWDNDELTNSKCKERGIYFSGRPQFTDVTRNQEDMMSVYQQAKFILAFSNLSHTSNYTHPKRAYLTGRWVDSLACGCIVAGISPVEESVLELLWDGATLELGSVRINDGVKVLESALSEWTHVKAEYNYQKSLKKLDWRWRFMEITNMLEISPKSLLDEIDLLNLELN